MTPDMAGGPIFLLGIQRGGTNQLLNILRSHPDTCWPQGEFHEVFRWRGLRREGPRAVLAKTIRYAPVRVGVGDILDPDCRAPRWIPSRKIGPPVTRAPPRRSLGKAARIRFYSCSFARGPARLESRY